VNVEVSERPLRRRFTAEYKARILAAGDRREVPVAPLAGRTPRCACTRTAWRTHDV